MTSKWDHVMYEYLTICSIFCIYTSNLYLKYNARSGYIKIVCFSFNLQNITTKPLLKKRIQIRQKYYILWPDSWAISYKLWIKVFQHTPSPTIIPIHSLPTTAFFIFNRKKILKNTCFYSVLCTPIMFFGASSSPRELWCNNILSRG